MTPRDPQPERGDVAIGPDGREWTVMETFVEPRFGMLVSVTVSDGATTEILDAADEVWWDDGTLRVQPNPIAVPAR